jgi:hypothetical protein
MVQEEVEDLCYTQYILFADALQAEMKHEYDLRSRPNNPKRLAKQQSALPKITKANLDIGENKQQGDETRISLGGKENEKVEEQSSPNTNIFNLTNKLNKMKVPIPLTELHTLKCM